MTGMEEDRFRSGILTPDTILPLKPGEAKELFLIIGAKQDVKKSTIYGARLISGAIEVLEHLARRRCSCRKSFCYQQNQRRY